MLQLGSIKIMSVWHKNNKIHHSYDMNKWYVHILSRRNVRTIDDNETEYTLSILLNL